MSNGRAASAPPAFPVTSLANAWAFYGDAVPVRHFGVVLSRAEWEALAERLRVGLGA